MLVGLSACVLSCGTDAVGVGTCRSIESARCEAAKSCGLIEDVDACQRFSRDHCLHGVGLENDPGTNAVNRCITAIERAGRCAAAGRDDPQECRGEGYFGTEAETVCEIVREPELAPSCRFLVPPVEEPEPLPETESDAGSGGGK
jgi:hypothetical protein